MENKMTIYTGSLIIMFIQLVSLVWKMGQSHLVKKMDII